MRQPSLRNWEPWGATASRHITDDATPPAKASLLAAAVNGPIDVATTPYCGCARLFESGTPNLETRYFATVIAPGAVHATASLVNARALTTAVGAKNNAMTTAQGGAAGADIITVLSVDPHDRGFYPTPDLMMEARDTAAYVNDAPAASIERALELEALLIPKIEPCSVSYACGISLCVSQIEDLEVL